MLAEEGVERLPGAHCYEFFATAQVFAQLCEAEPGTFYLTDFLLRHFERLVVRSLGLDRHPELAGEYFRHYKQARVSRAERRSPATWPRRARSPPRFGFAFEYRVHRLRRARRAPAHPDGEAGCPGMASLIIISWRDIPAQVVVKRGRETAKVQLSPRFQEAVDRAAMRAGKGSSDAYLADWKRSEARPCGDDLQAEVAGEAARIEARYTDEELER